MKNKFILYKVFGESGAFQALPSAAQPGPGLITFFQGRAFLCPLAAGVRTIVSCVIGLLRFTED